MATTKEQKQAMASVELDMTKEKGLHPRENQFYSFDTYAPIFHGRVAFETEAAYYLAECSWVPDTGRRSEYAQKASIANEAEYIGDYVLLKSAVIGFHPCADNKSLKTK